MEQITVAIADDHDMLRNSLGTLLETLGYNVSLSVGNGELLLQGLRNTNKLPDVCILDVNIPGRNGRIIARELKQQWPAVKIIAFTVNKDKPWKKIMLEAGADFFLRKDSHPSLLHEVIQYVCRGNKNGQLQPALSQISKSAS